jgi:tetratricopeptide (TPR) repeat protein
MAYRVFISYAREVSGLNARALKDELEDLAFFDTVDIRDGESFPQRLLDGVLDARVVVIFATKRYAERRFCRLEMGLALKGGGEHVVVAMGDGAQAVVDGLPVGIANRNWPKADESAKLAALVRQRLEQEAGATIRARLGTDEARAIAAVFREETEMPEPKPLPAENCSVPPGVATASIGKRFVGRAEELRALHQALLDGASGAAQLTNRIAAGGGFGKTRLAVEYFHRYGPVHYPGGLIWVNAAAGDLAGEFHRVLQRLAPGTPDLAAMRAEKRDIRGELEKALRGIQKPVLYVVDDIPEARAGEAPRRMSEYCPALGAVTVLATSRQRSGEAGVRNVALDTLMPEAAVLLLTEEFDDVGALEWSEWERIGEWVGYLPLALDLLNLALVLGSIAARDLLARATAVDRGTQELDRLSEALAGQVPEGAARGITEAFGISFEKLDGPAREAAQLLAQLTPGAPIPDEVVTALVKNESERAKVRTALQARHFVTRGEGLSFGTMHRLMADYLRTVSGDEFLTRVCQGLEEVMTPKKCRDWEEWPVMTLCAPHAEDLFERGSAKRECAVEASWVGLAAGILATARGAFDQALHLEERVLGVLRAHLGAEHTFVLKAKAELALTSYGRGDYEAARRLQRPLLGALSRSLGEEHHDTLAVMSNLAATEGALGNLGKERKLEEQVLKVRLKLQGEDDEESLKVMSNLGLTLYRLGELSAARDMQERAAAGTERVLGEGHIETLKLLGNLAITMGAQGDFRGERQVEERIVVIRKERLGEDHPDTLTAMNNLAATFRDQEEFAAAREMFERVADARRRVLGEEHPSTLNTLSNLATTLRDLGELKEEQKLTKHVLQVRARTLGEEHPQTLSSLVELAASLGRSGEYQEKRRLEERALAGQMRMLGAEHPDTLRTMNNLAVTLLELNEHRGAQRWFRQCVQGRRKVLGRKHPSTVATEEDLRLLEDSGLV